MTLGQRYIRFWVAVLTYHYLLTVKKIPQEEEEFKTMHDIFLKVCEAASKHGFAEGELLIEYWELR